MATVYPNNLYEYDKLKYCDEYQSNCKKCSAKLACITGRFDFQPSSSSASYSSSSSSSYSSASYSS